MRPALLLGDDTAGRRVRKMSINRQSDVAGQCFDEENGGFNYLRLLDLRRSLHRHQMRGNLKKDEDKQGGFNLVEQ